MRSYPQRGRRPMQFFWSCVVGLLAFTCTLGLLLLAVLATNASDLSAALGIPTLEFVGTTPSALSAADASSTPTPAPLRTVTLLPTVTAHPQPPTALPAAPAGPYPSRAVEAFGQTITVVEHFLLNRPVPPGDGGASPSWYYLYGTTEGGTLRVHHGDDFENPLGTPLLAVADGTIVVVEPDNQPVCGDHHDVLCGPQPDFYGNPIVERLDVTYHGQPIYILYGHLDSYAVAQGQHIQAGQQIGRIGESGVADGPHVHIEVRIGVNDYAHTRNTFLWLKPLPNTGVLTGQVLDANGQHLHGAIVDLYTADGSDEVEWTESYSTDNTASVIPDDDMHENYVLGDLAAGTYLLRVSINGKSYYQNVTIEAGHISYLVFRPS